MIPRSKVGRGVSGAVRYALSEGRDAVTRRPRTAPKGDQTRIAWVGGTGFGFAVESLADVDLARRIMEFDALNQTSPTRLCEKDCVHLSLGWRPGEEPTREQMEAAALSSLKSLGMENARAIFVAHRDEPYAHLHIVASKINPETGRAYDLKGDYLKLSKWAESYELNHSGGIVCTRRVESNQLREAIERRDAPAVLELMTQQRATFKARDLERILAKQIRTPYERVRFGEEILRLPQVVPLVDPSVGAQGRFLRYTTSPVLEAEGQVLLSAAALSAANHHAVDPAFMRSILARDEFNSISREQVEAVRRVTGKEGLSLIDGQAGTGKSFALQVIRKAYGYQGYSVVGLAPTNAVAEDMREAGFARTSTIHAELFRLNSGRGRWTNRTVIVLDEAAMVDTKLMAQVTRHAEAVDAKLILVGDDRQLSSIDRGGMFGVLNDKYGAAELATVRRQVKHDDRRASELMAEGNFAGALAIYDAKGAVHWTGSQADARELLVEQWAKDSAADASKSRFVFAYTNEGVGQLNAEIRAVRRERGELGEDRNFVTTHGEVAFAVNDRVQITSTDKAKGLVNGTAGTIKGIEGDTMTLKLDGRSESVVEFDAKEFQDFRHGYAGTIYKGQGRTLDQTYLYHSEHWRSAPGYVALTRHRDKVELFVARNTADDLKHLARQMGRLDDRRAASSFQQTRAPVPVQPLDLRTTPAVDISDRPIERSAPEPLAGWAASPGLAAQQQSALKALKRVAESPATRPSPPASMPAPDRASASPAAVPAAPALPAPNPVRGLAGETAPVRSAPLPTPVKAKEAAPPTEPLGPNDVLSRFGDAAKQAQYDRQQREQRQDRGTASKPPTPSETTSRGSAPPEKQDEVTKAQEERLNRMLNRFTRETDERHNDRGNDRSGGRGGRGRSR